MNPKLFFKQIILPILLSGSMTYLLSIIEYYNCNIIFDGNKSDTILSSIIQIEGFLFTIVVAVLTIRLNLIDNALKRNMEKFNAILTKYEYYGYVLFESQYERNYLKLIPKIDEKLIYSKNNNLREDYTTLMLDKRNIEFCFKTAMPELNKYRKAHFEAVKNLIILLLIIIIVALFAIYFDFENLCFLKKSLNTGVFILSIYSVFITYFSLKELFKHPFNSTN